MGESVSHCIDKKKQLAGVLQSAPVDVSAHVFLGLEVAALAPGHMIQAPSQTIPRFRFTLGFTTLSLWSIRLAKHVFRHLLYSFERNG